MHNAHTTATSGNTGTKKPRAAPLRPRPGACLRAARRRLTRSCIAGASDLMAARVEKTVSGRAPRFAAKWWLPHQPSHERGAHEQTPGRGSNTGRDVPTVTTERPRGPQGRSAIHRPNTTLAFTDDAAAGRAVPAEPAGSDGERIRFRPPASSTTGVSLRAGIYAAPTTLVIERRVSAAQRCDALCTANRTSAETILRTHCADAPDEWRIRALRIARCFMSRRLRRYRINSYRSPNGGDYGRFWLRNTAARCAQQAEVVRLVWPQLFAGDCAAGELLDVGAVVKRHALLAVQPIGDLGRPQAQMVSQQCLPAPFKRAPVD